MFRHALERLYPDKEHVFTPLTIPERNLTKLLIEHNSKMGNNKDALWRRREKKNAEAAKKKKRGSILLPLLPVQEGTPEEP